MSNSKPLPPFTFDVLCYLNRDQLERFSIVCCPLKNVIDRYFGSKPFRVFDRLEICGEKYSLYHNNDVQWHPNRDDNSAQKFLAGQEYSIDIPWNVSCTYYSFAEMRPYLGPTVRIKWTTIFAAGDSIYNPEHIAEMESITYLWRDGNIDIRNANGYGRFGVDAEYDGRIVAEDFLPILNSPTILQCRKLDMYNVHFSFKDYKVLYILKVIEVCYEEDEIDLWLQYWQQFLEQPGVKPLVVFHRLWREFMDIFLDRLSKAFSTAVSPNAYKIVFVEAAEPLTKFRKMNKNSGEILDLKKGLPVEYQNKYYDKHYDNYTMERTRI